MGWMIYFEKNDTGIQILRCVGDGCPLTLPETIDGLPVTALGPNCFGSGAGSGESGFVEAAGKELPPVSRDDGNLSRISLPGTITSIGEKAFARCRKLQRLTLPDSLVTLGARVFEWCGSLAHIDLPKGVTQVPEYAFSQCRKLERVTFQGDVTTIGHHCFYNCVGLKELELPDTVSMIGEEAFMNCKNLAKMTLPLGVNLSVLLSDLSNDLDLTVHYPDGAARFFLPGFSYEYEDINAPRMWRTITYGSGQLYRECFSSRDVDFELYESYFDLALKQDSVEDTVRIAWYRLSWDYGLHHGREIYRSHLIRHCEVLMRSLLAEEDFAGLERMLTLLELSDDQLDRLTQMAEKAGQIRFVARLMEAHSGSKGGAEKEFDL